MIKFFGWFSLNSKYEQPLPVPITYSNLDEAYKHHSFDKSVIHVCYYAAGEQAVAEKSTVALIPSRQTDGSLSLSSIMTKAWAQW